MNLYKRMTSCIIRVLFNRRWVKESILNINSWTLMALSTHLNWCINDLKNIYIRYTWIDALIV